MTFRPIPTLVLACALGSACAAPAPPPAPAASLTRVDPATAGGFAGRVIFEGTPPAADPLRMGSDQACVQGAGPNPLSDAVLVSSSGGLRNAFVWVKEGLDPQYGFDVPTTPVILDQKGCVYTPRVIGVMAGQPLEVVNSDPTMHNVHALPMKNQEFNQGQPMQGMRLSQTFTVPEVPVRFVCNVHNWMAAYVGVVAHPYFAVTDAEGRFSIAGLPPGTYTVEAWHEKFGTRTQTITIATGATADAAFTFQPAPKG